MGSIATTIDRDSGLTTQTVKGAVTAEEIAGAIDAYYRGEPTPAILWDFREGDMTALSSEDVSRLIELTKRYADRRPGGKTAMVFGSEHGFGMGRMYEQRQDVREPSTVSHMSFHSMEDARAWLGR